jgi:Mg-chelatase subunit ChlD
MIVTSMGRFCLSLACLAVLPGCRGPSPIPSGPLTWGDAEWPQAPIPQPGGEGNDEGDGGDDGDDGGGGSGPSFLDLGPHPDFHAGSQCDPFLQDCPQGEKCVAYASGGVELDANKCVVVMGSGMPGHPCIYSGVVEAIDDCDGSSYCWDVTEVMGTVQGACAPFCTGTPDSPQCPADLECLIAYDDSINLCVDPSDGDTGTESGTPSDMAMPDGEPEKPWAPLEEQVPIELECPDTADPIVLYMSNDDSNSQASPALVRRLIHEGQLVHPERVRIHEFLNYYTITADNPVDKPAEVGIQMRRTSAELGEFSLLLYAEGQQLRDQDRPPLNLVFSLDTSGSMEGERIELVKDSMVALAGSLRADDVISLVGWNSGTSVLLANHVVAGPDDPMLMAAIESIETGGSTDLHFGLVKAYELAETSYIEGGINRVILMSDGGANTGVTDIALISEAAQSEDGGGIYLVGVGVGEASSYRDDLMDAVTDAGKGAYVFIDSPAEAELQFTERFLSNVAVAARNVRMRATLPWYFGVKSFHGEEYSADPAEVEPQHLAPNDAMSFHQIIGSCNPDSISPSDTIEAHVEYLHPLTLEPMTDTLAVPLGALVKQDATALYKADVVVAFAKSIIVIGALMQQGDKAGAIETAEAMHEWLSEAAVTLDDPEVEELAALMLDYSVVLVAIF